MKRKNKIVTAATITILSLSIISTFPECSFSKKATQTTTNIEPQVSQGKSTQTTFFEVPKPHSNHIENDEISAQNEPLSDRATKLIVEKSTETKPPPIEPLEEENTGLLHWIYLHNI